MRTYSKTYRWLLAAWLMLFGLFMTPAQAQHYGTSYKDATYRRMYHPTVSRDACPTYQFQSTSALMPSVSGALAPQVSAPFASHVMSNGPRRSPWDDDEEDEPGDNALGEVDDPAPVGEPLILLLFICLYAGYRFAKSHRKSL